MSGDERCPRHPWGKLPCIWCDVMGQPEDTLWRLEVVNGIAPSDDHPVCRRCLRLMDQGEKNWNAQWTAGVLTGHVCPACQTAEENAEAEINDATLDLYKDEQGRMRGKIKR
jgi:hypothetical protein